MAWKLLGIYYDYYIKGTAGCPANNEWMNGDLYLGIAIRDLVLSATKYYFTYQLFHCSRIRLLFVPTIVCQWQSGKLHAENLEENQDFHIIIFVELGSLWLTGKCDIFPYLIYGWYTGNLLSTFVADGEGKAQAEIVIVAYRFRFPNNWFTIDDMSFNLGGCPADGWLDQVVFLFSRFISLPFSWRFKETLKKLSNALLKSFV